MSACCTVRLVKQDCKTLHVRSHGSYKQRCRPIVNNIGPTIAAKKCKEIKPLERGYIGGPIHWSFLVQTLCYINFNLLQFFWSKMLSPDRDIPGYKIILVVCFCYNCSYNYRPPKAN